MPVDPADELRAALEPFAAFADPNHVVPRDFVITAGSSFAKRQLTMGNCYDASALLAAARAPAELDVELLAEAIRRVPVAVMGASQTYANEAAAAIAREHAALAAAKDEPHD